MPSVIMLRSHYFIVVLSVVVLSIVMLSVFMLSVFMLSVFVLSVVMESVVALQHNKWTSYKKHLLELKTLHSFHPVS